MKTIFAIILLVAAATTGNAQVRTVQPSNTIQKKVANIAPKKTTDLAISILKIEDNSIPKQNQYTVYYTVTNVGTEDINRYMPGGRSFSLSGYFSGPTTEPGSFWGNASGSTENFQMVITEDNRTGNSVLKPGESSRGTLKVCKFNPNAYDYTGYLNPANYKFVLKADSKNEITEDNENNNTAEMQLPIHINTPDDLFLTGVTVTIQTGNDNKEANNSDVTFSLSPYQVATSFELKKYSSEIKVNSTISLDLNNTKPIVSPQNSLAFYKQKGMQFMVKYYNRAFPTDAWKINSVSLKLNFKDRFGNDLRTVAVNFPNANGILGYRFGDNAVNNENQKRWLSLRTDGSFNTVGTPLFISCFCKE